MKLPKLIILFLVIGVFLYIRGFYNTYKYSAPTKIQNSTNVFSNLLNSTFDSKIYTKEKPASINTLAKVQAVEDIYNENLTFKKSKPAYIAELYWLNWVMTQVTNGTWSGVESDSLQINPGTIPNDLIEKFKQDAVYRENKFTIPSNMEKFYFGSSVESTLLAEIESARNEFVNYLKEKGVAQKYIDEINNNTLPSNAGRIKYHPVQGSNVDPSATQGLMDAQGNKNDYSKQQMDIASVDIYNHTRKIFESGVLGDHPIEGTAEFDTYYKRVQRIGLRYLVYHEMGHVLERAVDTVNSKDDDKQGKSSWGDASKSLWQLDTPIYIKWSHLRTFNDVNNHALSQESQAEGFSYEVLVSVFHMSDVQKRLTWEYLFGWLEESTTQFDSAMNIFQTKYPNYEITDIQNKIYKDIITKMEVLAPSTMAVYEVNKRLSDLPAYQGYLHPRKLENMSEVWNFLKD